MNTAIKVIPTEDTREVIFPATEYPLTPPKLHQTVIKSSPSPNTVTSNEVILSNTKNAHVWFGGPKITILDENKNTLYAYGNIDKDLVVNTKPYYLPGSTLVLYAPGSNNYYHWMVDIVPKLKVLELVGIDIADIDHFVLRDLNWSFQEKMLELLNIPKKKIHLLRKAPCISCENLYHVELRNFVGMRMHHFVPEYLRALFLKPKCQAKAHRKLYISRPPDEKRPIENEQEILDLVTAFGYEVLNVRGLNFYEQAQLFNSASNIITPHGAVLTNLVYCNPGTKVFELFGSHVFSYFYGLSNLCRLDYTAILRSPEQYDLAVDPNVGNKMSNQKSTRKESSRLNVDVLRKALLEEEKTLQELCI